jgi:hypothetical protein
LELFKSGFFSSKVRSSLGYVVRAENHLMYEEDGTRYEVPSFSQGGWPWSTWITVDAPSPTTGEVLPAEVAQRCARALRWLGWSVCLQNEAGEILEEFEPSGPPRSELGKCTWSPLD